MLKVKFYETVEDSLLKFAVIIAKHNGKWVFCKHRERDTYEIPGGHREEEETILDTARRELMEETGAVDFVIRPVCVYSVTGKNRVNETGEETYGMLYYADIRSFASELHSEMERVEFFEELPSAWTYPLIQPLLIEEYEKRKARHFSEKKIIRWGVLGTASIARGKVIPGMQKADNAALYAIAGRNFEKVKAFQEEFGFEKAYGSLEELLEDDKVDAVYIPLPNNLHKEWILKAAEKKKHILCEKPLTPTPEETREVIDFCRERGVILAEAFAYLHNPMTREIVRVVRSGQIGEPVWIEAHFFTKKWPEDNIRFRKDLYGGCTYDLACYNISMIVALMGEKPSQVEAMAHFLDCGVDDYSNLFLEFPSGVYASASCGMCSGQRAARLFVHGSEGSVETDIAYNGEGELTYVLTVGGKRQTCKVQVPSNYMLEIEQFGRCVLGEEAGPLVSNEFTIQVAEVLQEALKKIGY